MIHIFGLAALLILFVSGVLVVMVDILFKRYAFRDDLERQFIRCAAVMYVMLIAYILYSYHSLESQLMDCPI